MEKLHGQMGLMSATANDPGGFGTPPPPLPRGSARGTIDFFKLLRLIFILKTSILHHLDLRFWFYQNSLVLSVFCFFYVDDSHVSNKALLFPDAA